MTTQLLSRSYEVYALDDLAWFSRAPVPAKAGNYIYAKWDYVWRRWQPIYVGETGDLQDRLSRHEYEGLAIAHAATHVLYTVNPHGRHITEALLILVYDPPGEQAATETSLPASSVAFRVASR